MKGKLYFSVPSFVTSSITNDLDTFPAYENERGKERDIFSDVLSFSVSLEIYGKN